MRGKVPSVNEREHFKFQKRFKKSSGLRRKIKLLDKIHLASSDTPNVRFGISPLESGGGGASEGRVKSLPWSVK